mmetsp:Transcript_16943/g.36630  ORF Transcript_16943/g.36630 Transcript_16943/m.36630 type:complete len:284 (-) Transcript_16943:14-865(-)|eukprot:CAMPEP_0172533910 /NCGR_PEP_ID=MMETSP1067-20121228/6463_1 /TAXON_ID=265564 ORGANISM="Thalassiosira punctigera, Strain Tpunct2005C2" /NCGR_SAMPLE_ID=MMETSP1067 /ASSEMBLY_ACC=CAM_ASM_000444 /LENGTH=283 /DNA_ID=CAMNT_0013318629 /DNA_START=41 /DNA_END=889 /DNA_ORIENTATION=+
MEGRGVTNYATGKHSFGFSAATTEFDDALLSRGIVSFEQAMIAKGASPSEARRLAELNRIGYGGAQSGLNQNDDVNSSNIQELGVGYEDVSDASSGDDEEKFIRNYRRMRINDIRKGRNRGYGDVIHISRPDWNREVNEASKDGLWVVVNLTRSSMASTKCNEICDKVEEVTKDLADTFVDVKFVSIPSTSAIENWPAENLPTIFCYRYGKMQHQLIGIDAMGGAGVTSGRLQWRLAMLGVLDTNQGGDPIADRTETTVNSGRSQFEGSCRREHQSDDYDEVD